MRRYSVSWACCSPRAMCEVNIQALRALRGVLDSEDALMAGLIIMQPLGKVQERNFRKSWRRRVI